MAEIQVTAFKCERCAHIWVPRAKERPVICPKCKSARWDKPKTEITRPSSFWKHKGIDELATEQSVYSIGNLSKIWGKWPADEDFDQFVENLETQRHQP